MAHLPAFAQASGDNTARAFFEGGVAAYRASEYRLASELFHDSVKAQPTTGALRNLGNSEWQRGRTGRAILAWEQAVWLDPFDRVARENLEFARKAAQVDAPELAWHEAASLYLPSAWWAWLAGLSLWVAIGAAVLPGILRVRKAAWHQAVAAIGLAGFSAKPPGSFWHRQPGENGLQPVEVGTPVARCPPHRSRRAVFPHRALQINSLSHTPVKALASGGSPPDAGTNSSPTGKAYSRSFPQCAVSALGIAPADG
jgi:hypothetical protein